MIYQYPPLCEVYYYIFQKRKTWIEEINQGNNDKHQFYHHIFCSHERNDHAAMFKVEMLTCLYTFKKDIPVGFISISICI